MWCLNLPLQALINNMPNCFPFPSHSSQMECYRCDWTTLTVFMLQTNGVTVCGFPLWSKYPKDKAQFWKFICVSTLVSAAFLIFIQAHLGIWAHLKVHLRIVAHFCIVRMMRSLENQSFERDIWDMHCLLWEEQSLILLFFMLFGLVRSVATHLEYTLIHQILKYSFGGFAAPKQFYFLLLLVFAFASLGYKYYVFISSCPFAIQFSGLWDWSMWEKDSLTRYTVWGRGRFSDIRGEVMLFTGNTCWGKCFLREISVAQVLLTWTDMEQMGRETMNNES